MNDAARFRSRGRRALAVAPLVVGLAVAPTAAAAEPNGGDPAFSWHMLDSGTGDFLVGLDAVSDDVAWVGAFGPTVLRTVDGGTTFEDVTPSDASADWLFPDVEAFSADHALVIVGIPGESQRIYRTADGGVTWTERFRTETAASALNCIAMFDRQHGFVMGDPVEGKFEVIVTSDGGRSWVPAPRSGMPDALEGEFGAASGGECATATGREAFFGTSFGEQTRVFRSSDLGQTWDVSTTPIGLILTALDFRTNRLGLASGGDFFTQPLVDSFARSTDGGVTWELVDESVGPSGWRADVAWWSDRRGNQRSQIPDAQRTVFAVGETGSDVSRDRGKTWEQFDDGTFASVDCVARGLSCWAAGDFGRIAKLVVS